MPGHSPARGVSRLKVTTRRRISLIQPIIGIVAHKAFSKCGNAPYGSEENEFWTEFLTSWLSIGGGNKGLLRAIRDEHANSLKEILRVLESMVDLQSHIITDEFRLSKHPRLQTIKKLFAEGDQRGEQQKFMDSIMISKPDTTQDCMHIVEQLSKLVNGLRSQAQTPTLDYHAASDTRRCLMSPLLMTMCSKLSNYWECSHQHEALMPLFTYKKRFPDADTIPLTIFLNRENPSHQWQETCITLAEQLTKFRHITLDMSRSVQKHPGRWEAQRIPVLDLCKVIAETELSRLNLDLEDHSLFLRSVAGAESPGIADSEIVSLTDSIFSVDQTEIDFAPKICLALVLSYSLGDFCDQSWFPRVWSSNSVYLAQNNGRLNCLPYLQARVKTARHHRDQKKNAANVALLHHGLLLMETFLQESSGIEITPERELTELREEIKDYVGNIDSQDWDVHEQYRQVVETCIDADLDVLASKSMNKFLGILQKKVLAPLEFEFTNYWEGKDLDEVMSTLRLPALRLPESAMANRSNMFYNLIHNFAQPPSGLPPQAPIFFDVEDNVEKTHIDGARKWFRYFDPSEFASQLALRSDGKGRRIKIAVLDTGINLQDQWISAEKGRIKCWPQDSCHDEVGHGTHVSYLILRLARHIELHVHKISNSERLADADIIAIAEAIKTSSHGEGKVDIINLSFGFKGYHDQLEPIRDAIKTARNQGVLLFAASGNNGLNESCSWPASLEEDVVQINASDSDGRGSSFSSDGGSRGNIYTLGKGVPSCMPGSDGEPVYRSGTSFATPIAVAIAAMVLGFVDSFRGSKFPEGELHDFEVLASLIRTRRGIVDVLRQVCVLQQAEGRPAVAYITPWHFLEMEENTRIRVIMQILRGLKNRGLTT